MIDIEVTSTGISSRGMLWTATAIYEGKTFVVTDSLQPERDVLRAVIDQTPGFTDSPWRLMRNGQADLSGRSARWRAKRRITEGPAGIKYGIDPWYRAAIHGPSRVEMYPGSPEIEMADKTAVKP